MALIFSEEIFMDPKIREQMEALERAVMAKEFERTTEARPALDAWGNPYKKRSKVSEIQLTPEERLKKHIEFVKEYTKRVYRCDKEGNPIADVNGKFLRDRSPASDVSKIKISGFDCEIWTSADGATFVAGLPLKSEASKTASEGAEEPTYSDIYVRR